MQPPSAARPPASGLAPSPDESVAYGTHLAGGATVATINEAIGYNMVVTEAKETPLVTFALFTYNQREFVQEAVEAALAQDYVSLEIIISDDCSGDGTYEVIERIAARYVGPHKVLLRRNELNLGFAAHVNLVMKECRGRLIVVAAGDDISRPNRVSRVVQQWRANSYESGSIFSRFSVLYGDGRVECDSTPAPVVRYDAESITPEMLKALAFGTSGCAHSWTRDLFEIFGPLDQDIMHEDIAFALRAILIGSVTFVPDELVTYRVHSGSLSRPAFGNYLQRIEKMGRYWFGREKNVRQFQEDMVKAVGVNLIRPEVAARVEGGLRREFERVRLYCRFFSGNRLARVAVAISSDSLSFWERIKLLVIAIAPWAYGFRVAP